MIIDFLQGKMVLFSGSEYFPILEEQIDGTIIFGKDMTSQKYAINSFVCIIQFSKPTYTIPGKKDVIRKESVSLIHKFPKILTKTKKLAQQRDMYAIVKIEKVENNIIYCDVVSYLGVVGDEVVEAKFMEHVCTAHWKRTKDITQKFLKVKDIDLTPNRTDLTSYTVYSIDPRGCRDIDDALHYVYHEATNEHEIGIHIADVSSFIQKDSEIDNELKRRIETIYDYKRDPIHMIPEELSINHISLLEGIPKRAFSVILKLNDKYEIKSIEFKKTMICVTKNLTYEEAQEMIGSDDVVNGLLHLYNIGMEFKEQIPDSFPKDETYQKVALPGTYDTHQMVAIYMIYANKLTAEKIKSMSQDRVLLRTNHPSIKTQTNYNNVDSFLLKKYNINHKEQALYQTGIQNSYHHSLNLEFYTHMTSPIRRYADIIVHRQLYNAIYNKDIDILDCSDVFSMNFYKKYYRQTERYMRIIEISSKLGMDCQEADAYITMINEDKESIRLYVPGFDFDYDLTLIHSQMKNIKKSRITDGSIIISDVQEKTEIKYSLFQKIKVKIIASKSSFVKLKLEIIL